MTETKATIKRFWFSAKHAEHYRRYSLGRTTVLIDGERKEYTECTAIDSDAPSCSVARGGVFDDYALLGDADESSIQRRNG